MDAVLRRRIAQRIDALRENPRPTGAKALAGDHGGLYPVCVGDVRVVYAVRDGELLVLVVKVGHREDVYR